MTAVIGPILSISYSEYVNGAGRCEAAHVNIGHGDRGQRGMGEKAIYSAVPLTREKHQNQADHGYAYYKPESWWIKQRDEYARRWAWERLKIMLRHGSFAECLSDDLVLWAKEHNVLNYLSRDYYRF